MRRPTKSNQSGSSAVELIIVVVVLAVVGVVGYTVYSRHNNKTASTTATSQTTGANPDAKADDVASAQQISNASDLDKALSTLDQTDPAGSNNTDATQLTAQSADF